LLLLRRHLVIRDFGVTAKGRCLGHFGFSFLGCSTRTLRCAPASRAMRTGCHISQSRRKELGSRLGDRQKGRVRLQQRRGMEEVVFKTPPRVQAADLIIERMVPRGGVEPPTHGFSVLSETSD